MIIFSKGSYRYVFAVPALGIVVKIPHLIWSIVFYHVGQILLHILKGEWLKLSMRLKVYRELTVRHHFTIKAALGKGVLDNWEERQYYKHTNSLYRILLQPTYVSFFGLLNIQKYGIPLGEAENYEAFLEWWEKWYKIAGQSLIIDGHHFENAGNFHNSFGQIKFLDYGNDRTQEIVENFGLKILQEFKL